MCIRKKVMAAILVAVMATGMAFTASAATSSPTNGNTDSTGKNDPNTQDHVNKVVDSTVSGDKATVVSVKSNKGKKGSTTVVFEVARNKDNKKVPITSVGNGKKGVFDSKKGRVVTKVIIKSKAKKVTVKKNAFKKSKVKTIIVRKNVKKVQINKNAFKGTKAKTLTLNVKKAKQLVVKKGALKGLKKIKIKGASKKQKAKIIKKLVKAGFKKKNIK